MPPPAATPRRTDTTKYRIVTIAAAALIGSASPLIADAQPVTIPPAGPIDTSKPAPAPEPTSEIPDRATGVAANLMIDVSNSSSGTFMQFVPEIGYDFARCGLAVGVPIESGSG